ncbi:BolA family protein [Thorsellia anophelis]|uniref:Transcriptional regulator, BolA protein family n=1 Tax=Thorsellia anophelis DSM 18579 TaxID=1123402 RepID=A0A1I0DF35_9GAMM|nr:BolA/IbaG family iron-sulfur metabolism protein [Thorsellia anophelis]SET30668.1 transcriptional regulator, BolA protein family [Thorsellia anophelis DSM 18579]
MDIQSIIESKLTALSPLLFEVTNESHNHSVPKNSETHFKVVVVSNEFKNTMLIGRHRKIYALLADLMQNPIHALALHTFTPEEWDKLDDKSLVSPKCLGGSKSD